MKKLDIEEIENKIGELKGSLLKNNITKLNQGEFNNNIFIRNELDMSSGSSCRFSVEFNHNLIRR